MFSKTFAYALRGILYIVATGGGKKVRIEEISKVLGIPKYFLAKVMNKTVRAGMLSAVKGPNGGFSANQNTLDTKLIDLILLIDGPTLYDGCVLHLGNCDYKNPCPMHSRMEENKRSIMRMLSSSTIKQLLEEKTPDFLSSITYNPTV